MAVHSHSLLWCSIGAVNGCCVVLFKLLGAIPLSTPTCSRLFVPPYPCVIVPALESGRSARV
jgi:peroxiredoxin